jgi:transcriptional regulator with XRE-family HTH domain
MAENGSATMGGRISAARARAGFATQTALARALDVTRQAVSAWETGAAEPSAQQLRSLAVITNTSYDFLATGRGAWEPQPTTSITGAKVIGIAQAETWTEEAAMRSRMSQENHTVPGIPDTQMRQFALLTEGTSANASIRPGEYAICVDFEDCRPGGPHEGDLVALRKWRALEIRTWIARLRFMDGAWQAHYESTDPRWQKEPPVRFAPGFTHEEDGCFTHDAADSCKIKVMGCVTGAFRYDPQPNQTGGFSAVTAPKKPRSFWRQVAQALATPVPAGWIASPASVALNWAVTLPTIVGLALHLARSEANPALMEHPPLAQKAWAGHLRAPCTPRTHGCHFNPTKVG